MSTKVSFLHKLLASFFSPSEEPEKKEKAQNKTLGESRYGRVDGNSYKQMINGTFFDGRVIQRRQDKARTSQTITAMMPGVGDGRFHPSPLQLPTVPKLEKLLEHDPGLEKEIGVIESRYAGKVEEIKMLIANAKLSLERPDMSVTEKQVVERHVSELRRLYALAKIEHRQAKMKVAVAAKEAKIAAKKEEEKIT
ncbi:MAG: hypothetical protein A3I05_07635 [Deltaproteobacteria bacterium RIFCSPLOWO2_02_FULL_44_10]|nr:MAG: hypothetical protein A3C46_04365 [Deltaproteobacteria bacterium RIFCSPHIGHO2_02_FULL_44_16]OGQ47044.1 MAG: hypothetical protein A3I05_07635 [Deltaproteobacteria bacterium RIFCSPLOWO2_02_FULL_44_10]